MISRLWHGWTKRDNADRYEELLRSEILPGIHRVAGFKGALVLRRDGKDEVEFVTLTMFDSMAAVKEFAGEDYEVAGSFTPHAKQCGALLSPEHRTPHPFL